jgi:hypothetical protein
MTHEDLFDLLLRQNFERFLRRCMQTLNPGAPFLRNWHIAAIAHQLQRVQAGELTRPNAAIDGRLRCPRR